MPKLTFHCPICNKQLILIKEHNLANKKLNEYKCGHIFASDLHCITKGNLNFHAVDGSGKAARPYQQDGIQFILESDFNCIIGDQMRLGKTPQALLALKNDYKNRTPVLIIPRSANLWQWCREYKVWCDTLPNGIFPIIGTQAWIPPGFSAYVVGMDTFSRPAMLEKLKKIPFKLLIVDEAHSFKNTDSNRSQALVDFVTYLNTDEESLELHFTCERCTHQWIEKSKRTYDKRIGRTIVSKSAQCPQCRQYCYIQQQHQEKVSGGDRPCGLVLLTGTAIKNRAEEYFVPLNLVAPDKFNSIERFRRQWLQQDSRGRWSYVKPYYMEAFKETIKPYVLRREKEDVFTDLPPINRTFTVIEPDRNIYAKLYNQMIDKMEVKLADKANPSYWDFAEDLMELRRICGMMKLAWTADYLEINLLDAAEDDRFAIGIHHETVRDVLYQRLGGEQNCWKFSGVETRDRKNWLELHYQTIPQRIGIINMLAGGVGCDFHEIDNIIILERQWNSADEEQFEFRFYNPDLKIKARSTNIEYIIAKGTLDEWWFDMVENKRRIFGETISNNWSIQQDNGSFKELLEKTVGARL